MDKHITMQNLPESERPIEKFLKGGEAALSDAELLAVILRSGTRGINSTELSQRILSGKQNNLLNLYEYSYEELVEIPGIGTVKAIQLKAVAELSQRIASTQRGYRIRMQEPGTIAEYFMERMRHLPCEQFCVALFDAKCVFLGDAVVSRGSVSSAYVSPRDLFRGALIRNAAMIVLIHNHPSGEPQPSQDDIRLTYRMREIGKELGIDIIDHIIIGDNCYYSFKEGFLI